MNNFLLVLAFTGLTALCWGVYGPVLRNGTFDMEGSHWRPFVCVGVAYLPGGLIGASQRASSGSSEHALR
jgi:hypothetical protein